MRLLKYEPIIKGKGFLPNPVQRWGVPDFADTIANPKVKGTAKWEDWWNEQIHRCLNGYETGGMKIPGRLYYYLNFNYISTIKRGLHLPEFVDLDFQFAELIEEAKATNSGLIGLKKRRVGISEKMNGMVVGYGLRFTPGGYKAGVTAGIDAYAKLFFDKVKYANQNSPPEFKIRRLLSNDEEYTAGWSQLNEHGDWQNTGSMNMMICKTMFNNINVLKGNFFDDVFFEESGEYKFLKAGYGATQACFMVGDEMVGTPFISGTGGNIKSSSKDFKEMLGESKKLHLIPFFIDGPRLVISYFMGSRNLKGEVTENCPNIIEKFSGKGLTRDQLLGCEDTEAAKTWILKRRRELLMGKDKQEYYDFLQSYPLTLAEGFLNFSSNNYNQEKLADRSTELLLSPHKGYKLMQLDWVVDENGKPQVPLQVKGRLANDNDREEDCIWCYREPSSRPHRNLYVAGIDSYDLDQSAASKSLGAMLVFVRENSMKDYPSRACVCAIRTRPRRKEIFYEQCLKVSVWYNILGNVLIDIANGLIYKTFENFKCNRFLAVRPQDFESEKSEQQHVHGVRLHTFAKDRMIGLTQSYIEDEIQGIPFPTLLGELSDYDVKQTESDWDLADAFGIALIQDASIRKPAMRSEGEDDSAPVWVMRNGAYVDISRERRMQKRMKEESKNGGPQPDLFIQLMESGHFSSHGDSSNAFGSDD